MCYFDLTSSHFQQGDELIVTLHSYIIDNFPEASLNLFFFFLKREKKNLHPFQ